MPFYTLIKSHARIDTELACIIPKSFAHNLHTRIVAGQDHTCNVHSMATADEGEQMSDNSAGNVAEDA
jgi:hypothetical protein